MATSGGTSEHDETVVVVELGAGTPESHAKQNDARRHALNALKPRHTFAQLPSPHKFER
jgi:hypothetical protein